MSEEEASALKREMLELAAENLFLTVREMRKCGSDNLICRMVVSEALMQMGYSRERALRACFKIVSHCWKVPQTGTKPSP